MEESSDNDLFIITDDDLFCDEIVPSRSLEKRTVRLDAWENYRVPEDLLPYKGLRLAQRNDGTVDLDVHRMEEYVAQGITMNGDYFTVSAAFIDKPKYFGKNIVGDLLNLTKGGSFAGIYPKWDGMLEWSILCESEHGSFSLYNDGAFVKLRGPESPFVRERLANKVITLDGEGDEHTVPYFGMTDEMDGIIVIANDSEYRVKVENTYDLEVFGKTVCTSAGTVKGNLEKAPTGCDGKIVEVRETDTGFEYIKLRPDKVYPLSNEQFANVRQAVVYKHARELLQKISTKYTIMYGIYYYFHKLLNLVRDGPGIVTREYVTLETVTWNMPYAADELYCLWRNMMNGKVDAPFTSIVYQESAVSTVVRDGRQIFIGYPRLKPLTIKDFVESRPWAVVKTKSAMKKYLLNLGFFFTSMDFVYLMTKFVRGSYSFVSNPKYVHYVRPAEIEYNIQYGWSDLPYLFYATRALKIEPGYYECVTPVIVRKVFTELITEEERWRRDLGVIKESLVGFKQLEIDKLALISRLPKRRVFEILRNTAGFRYDNGHWMVI